MKKLKILAFLSIGISISFNAYCQKLNSDSLFSIVVEPIDNITKAIKDGKYTYVCPSIVEKNVKLQKVMGSKRIYFVPMNEHQYFSFRDVEKYLSKLDLILCEDAPNYLLGAMIILSKDKIPVSLKNKQFVALELNKSSIFTVANDSNNYLLRVDMRYVGTNHDRCELLFVQFNPIELNDECWPDGYESMSYKWVFLAEKP